MSEEKKVVLTDARHTAGLYSIKELAAMFGCGRASIDLAINSGKLKYLSPNNKTRFIYLKDFLEYSKKDNTSEVHSANVLSQDEIQKSS